MKLNPYLYFNGQCKEAFEFYEKCTGGKIVAMMTHEGTPASAGVGPEWQDKVLHARIMVGDTVLMASDAPPGQQETAGGYSITLLADTTAEAESVFTALSEGGTITMPMAETFFAVRFGMATDRFGTPWMVIQERTP
jgi:PhnB protein